MLDGFFLLNPWRLLAVSGTVSAIFLFLALLRPRSTERSSWILFLGITLPIAVATFFLIGSTVYLNVTSVTKGPVHWHADLLIIDCGNEVDLRNPRGLSNRIGTPLLHEHGDDRIHVEGVVMEYKDVSLPAFFRSIGGNLTNDHLVVPTNNGPVVRSNGERCPDGKSGQVQVFIYRTVVGVVSQIKLQDVTSFTIAPQSAVPPGDCVIVEFGPEKERTDIRCQRYGN